MAIKKILFANQDTPQSYIFFIKINSHSKRLTNTFKSIMFEK